MSEAWLPKLFAINKQHDPAGRYEQVMKAEGLFEVSIRTSPKSAAAWLLTV